MHERLKDCELAGSNGTLQHSGFPHIHHSASLNNPGTNSSAIEMQDATSKPDPALVSATSHCSFYLEKMQPFCVIPGANLLFWLLRRLP